MQNLKTVFQSMHLSLPRKGQPSRFQNQNFSAEYLAQRDLAKAELDAGNELDSDSCIGSREAFFFKKNLFSRYFSNNIPILFLFFDSCNSYFLRLTSDLTP